MPYGREVDRGPDRINGSLQ